MSEARGEYVPAPCTHRPSKHPSEVRMRLPRGSRIWASQGGLSRNKVAVGESAAGSPPTDPRASGPHLSLIWCRVRSLARAGTVERRWLTLQSAVLAPRSAGPRRRVGLIAQRESASFARRMPWVRIPVSPCQTPAEPRPLSVGRRWVGVDDDRCTTPGNRGWEGFDERPAVTGRFDDDRVYVRSRRPLNSVPSSWTYSTGYCASW